jgi:glycosyltransferase involved in cell wall biosynthesis
MIRKVSLCIPQYGRSDLVMETLKYPLQDDRIDEIIMCDDCSTEEDYHKLIENTWNFRKIKVIKNVKNFHNQHNKRNAISFAKNEWCILLDNDNVIDKDFVDKLFQIEVWFKQKIYHPSFAAPTFDYRQFNGDSITKTNVAEYCKHNIFMTLLNTNNYLVNRDEYLELYKYNPEVRGADGLFNSYNWLKAGNMFYIVPDLQYYHRVHIGSEFLRERDSNMKLAYYWLEQIKQLK